MQTLYFCPVVSSFFLLSFIFLPRLISPVADWMSTILPHMVWSGLSVNLRCSSETCCMRLAENTGCKKSPKIRHLSTIAQLSRAISLQDSYWQSVKKSLLNSNISPTFPYNMVNFGLLAAQIVSLLWGTPANFNGFCVLAALLHSTLVVGVSQTLRRWTEDANYFWQGDHHVGHWPTFYLLLNSLCRRRCCCKPTSHCNKSRDRVDIVEKRHLLYELHLVSGDSCRVWVCYSCADCVS